MGENLVAVGASGTVRSSVDGSSWSSRTSGTTALIYGVAHGDGRYVAVGADVRLVSSDGISWSAGTMGGATLQAVAWAESLALYVAVGSSGAVRTSTTGTSWTLRTSGTSATLVGVAWSGATFVALADNGATITSTNGTSWSVGGTIPATMTAVTWADSLGMFVAVGLSGKIYTSPNGTTWTSRTSGTANGLYAVTWSSSLGRLVAAGNTGQIVTSTDAVSWTPLTAGSSRLQGVTWGAAASAFVAVGTSGVLYTSSTGTGTWTSRASGTTNDLRAVAGVGNTAPNAPTLTAPADGATIDRNSVQRFAPTFSDPDAGDSPSKLDIQYRLTGAGTWTLVSQTSPNQFYDFPAGTFAAGDYEWQARYYDAQGVVGPYSGSSFFTAATAPPAPTITAPINGSTVTSTADVTWSAPSQGSYQLRRVKDNAGTADTATVYYDTGEVVSTTARSRSVTFETNSRYEHVQVRIKDSGLWSSWASVRVLVSFTPPTTPAVSLTPDAASGSLLVGISNPAPGAGVPATAYNDVYVDDGDGEERRATMLAPNSSWTYWTPRALRDYDGAIRVVAVGSNGTTASS